MEATLLKAGSVDATGVGAVLCETPKPNAGEGVGCVSEVPMALDCWAG